MEDIMTNDELHSYGIDLIISHLKKEGYTIIEVNRELNVDPQIVAQKMSDMIFVVVKTFMYPKKEKDIKISNTQLKIVKDGAIAYDAKCYMAKVGLAYANGNNAKELSTPYRNADFLVKFRGLVEI